MMRIDRMVMEEIRRYAKGVLGMAVNTCDFCNNDAVVRFMINDLPGAESCACAVHKDDAEKRVDSFKKNEVKTIPCGDNGKVFHRVELTDQDREHLASIEKAKSDIVKEFTIPETYLDHRLKNLSDDEAERYANRLWEFLLPKVLKEMTNLLHKEPIMSPDGTEIRGWVDRAPWQIPVLDIDRRRVAQSPDADIMEQYDLWSEVDYKEWLIEPLDDDEKADLKQAINQLSKTREVLKGFIYGKENKDMS